MFQLNSWILPHSNSSNSVALWVTLQQPAGRRPRGCLEVASGSSPFACPMLLWQIWALPKERQDPQPTERSIETAQMPQLQGNATGGATASSKGTQLVCRLPLAALYPLTRGCHPWRPAAVLQYGIDAGATIEAIETFKEQLAGHHSSLEDEEALFCGKHSSEPRPTGKKHPFCR